MLLILLAFILVFSDTSLSFVVGPLFPKCQLSNPTSLYGLAKKPKPEKVKNINDDGTVFQPPDIIRACKQKMELTVDNFVGKLNLIKIGMANPAILEKIGVNIEDDSNDRPNMVAIRTLARIIPTGPMQVTIEPYDKVHVPKIEKAILAANINYVSPMSDGIVIKVNFAAVTEETRIEVAKQVKGLSEDIKIAIRNIRKDTMDKFKVAEKNKFIGKDISAKGQVSCYASSIS